MPAGWNKWGNKKKKKSNSLDGDFNSPEYKITQHHAHRGCFNDSSQRWASPSSIKVSLHDQRQGNANI